MTSAAEAALLSLGLNPARVELAPFPIGNTSIRQIESASNQPEVSTSASWDRRGRPRQNSAGEIVDFFESRLAQEVHGLPERTPDRQCATISLPVSGSLTRLGRSPSGPSDAHCEVASSSALMLMCPLETAILRVHTAKPLFLTLIS